MKLTVTDPVSGPTTPNGKLLFAAGIGLLTWLIRTQGGYPDGVAFAVLLMIEIESSRVAQGRVQSDMLARSGLEHAMSLLRQDTVEQPGQRWRNGSHGLQPLSKVRGCHERVGDF